MSQQNADLESTRVWRHGLVGADVQLFPQPNSGSDRPVLLFHLSLAHASRALLVLAGAQFSRSTRRYSELCNSWRDDGANN